jgi:recombination protein RecT
MAIDKTKTQNEQKLEQALMNGGNSQSRGTTQLAKAAAKDTVAALMLQLKPQIEMALPKHVDIDRFVRAALTEIRKTPELMKCSKVSLMGALMTGAQLGLEFGPLGHAYMVPFGGEVTFIIGYKGMLDLIRRSGSVSSVAGHIVYEHDEFDLQYGLEESLRHVPWFCRKDAKEKGIKDGGRILGAYFVARMKDGGIFYNYLPEAEILEHKAMSKAANTKFSPWNTNELTKRAMYLKTAVRASWPWLPISPAIQAQVAETDDRVGSELYRDLQGMADGAMTIDVDASEVSGAAEAAADAQHETAEQTLV